MKDVLLCDPYPN